MKMAPRPPEAPMARPPKAVPPMRPATRPEKSTWTPSALAMRPVAVICSSTPVKRSLTEAPTILLMSTRAAQMM